MNEYRCKRCGRRFESSKALSEHSKRKHPVAYYSQRILVVVVIAAFAVIAGYALLLRPTPGQVIAGVPCEASDEPINFHVHTKLEIFLNGELRAIPEGIGIIPGVCLYRIHTHDRTGVLHIESPSEQRFTLGQFFAIWGEPLNDEQIWDIRLEGKEVRVYINDERYNGEIGEIALIDDRIITIDIGPPFAKG